MSVQACLLLCAGQVVGLIGCGSTGQLFLISFVCWLFDSISSRSITVHSAFALDTWRRGHFGGTAEHIGRGKDGEAMDCHREFWITSVGGELVQLIALGMFMILLVGM